MIVTPVILAAGQGTRMRSTLPKVLHPLLGRPMLHYTLEAARQATGTSAVVVVGFGAEQVIHTLGEGVRWVRQEPQLGTGHAVQQAESVLSGQTDLVLVCNADLPLLTVETLGLLVERQKMHTGPISLLSVISEDPRGFGRVVRDSRDNVKAIIEEAQADGQQLAIKELNSGVYCFSADWLWNALRRIRLSPRGEYYLTDLVEIAIADGLVVQAVPAPDPDELVGINTRVHLAEAGAVLRARLNRNWMLAGVTLIDPATIYIETDVTIGVDTVIWPNTILRGKTTIGAECTIGPNALIEDTHIGDHCSVLASVLESAFLDDNVEVGPYAHLRKGAHLERGVHMGNFGEVKNSTLGPGTKMGHFSYIGDATIGADVNIGAGTITCNFDGQRKHPTEIGAGVFIGSDTMLVAPVTVGDRARTGAGSVVTKNVPPDTLVVGVPARAIRKLKREG